jgi:nucleoid DNA-binding protein
MDHLLFQILKVVRPVGFIGKDILAIEKKITDPSEIIKQTQGFEISSVLPGFGKLVKQKRRAHTGFNPKTQQKIRIPAKTVLKFRVAKVAKDTVLGVKK